MNFKKFFQMCEEAGITAAQIQIGRSKAIKIKLFHHEIDEYRISSSQSVTACGIYKGKFGSASTSKLDKDTFAYLIKRIQLAALFNEKDGEATLFEGSPKYRKGNTFNKTLSTIPVSEKLAMLRRIEDGIYAADSCISDADAVTYTESEHESEFYNSFGLKLKQKGNHYFFLAGAVARKGEETKTAYDFHLSNDFTDFKPDEFVAKIVKSALAKFGGAPCKAGKYPTVLHHDVMADLVDYFLSSCSSDEVQRHSSFLEGKVGQRIGSSKLTIEEKPLTRNLYFSYFDDEGVATQNKVIVKRGVLQGFFYNRETAAKEGRESTGNGAWAGSKIGIAYGNIFVKPGKQSFDEMISGIEEGVYITEVAGLGTGMNAHSGDFSCQAEGFMIRNGKVAEPLNLITLSGNLFKMLKDLKAFDNAPVMTGSAISVADALIRSMSIGGN